MKTYKMLGTSKGGVIPASRKGGEWVPADVAHRLYAACSDAKVALQVEDALYFRTEIEACEKALAAADGDGGGDG